MRRAIREHLRDFVAVIALAVLALVITAVILTQQRVTFPGWVPGIGEDRFELRVELSSAQAVTPGQGQTVNIAGIKVGDVTEVELEDGSAVVTAEVDEEDASLIHPDATVLLRPRTGLQDMTLELDPGEAPGEIEDGAVIPVANTKPNVNVDQILASLDADTRDFLKLLLRGGGDGLGGRGEQLSAGLRRFEPTARDLARINGALAKRRRNLARVIRNFSLLAQELGRSDTQLAEFVSSSNAVLESFANQEVAIRATLRELPGALGETRRTLRATDRLSAEAAPAFRELVPAARALEPALRRTRPFFERTRGPIRDQIRPFTRQVREPVRDLRRLGPPLEDTTKGLRNGFADLNLLLNELSFNPPGREEGYLFWLAWLNHNTNSAFTLEDANGPILRGLIELTCETALRADPVTEARPPLETGEQVTRIPQSGEICPEQPPLPELPLPLSP